MSSSSVYELFVVNCDPFRAAIVRPFGGEWNRAHLWLAASFTPTSQAVSGRSAVGKHECQGVASGYRWELLAEQAFSRTTDIVR